VPGHILRNGCLTHGDSQFQEFAANAWRAPQRVSFRHPANQLADVAKNARSTQMASALPRPGAAEAATMPGGDRLGLDEHHGCPPFVPDSQQPDLQHSVGLREPQSLRPQSVQHVELMAQRQNLALQGSPIAERHPDRQEQRDNDGSHHWTLSADGGKINVFKTNEILGRAKVRMAIRHRPWGRSPYPKTPEERARSKRSRNSGIAMFTGRLAGELVGRAAIPWSCPMDGKPCWM
jgi:hypothetical protein